MGCCENKDNVKAHIRLSKEPANLDKVEILVLFLIIIKKEESTHALTMRREGCVVNKSTVFLP